MVEEEVSDMRSLLNSNATLAAGILAGIGASACCLGPLLFLSLGLGGAWLIHLTNLAPYRPIFVALTLLFLGLTFWRLYLRPQACATGEDCEARAPRAQRIAFWILAPLILVVVASPWILPILLR